MTHHARDGPHTSPAPSNRPPVPRPTGGSSFLVGFWSLMEKHVPPLWLLAVLSAVLGLVAQLGTSLAMDMARDKGKLYGFLLLSLVFSASTTVLLVQLTALDDYVCATVGTLAGAIPPLWTLRAAVKLIGQKYGVELGELTNPAGPAAPKKEGDAT